MREIRLYGSEGGGAVCSPYPYPGCSGRVGPLSPCARFLLERPHLESFHNSPSQGFIPLTRWDERSRCSRLVAVLDQPVQVSP
jgi:hypothetical protein